MMNNKKTLVLLLSTIAVAVTALLVFFKSTILSSSDLEITTVTSSYSAAQTASANAAESQTPPKNKGIPSGHDLYLPCAVCHGDQAEGNREKTAPSLRVQEDWYIVRQLEKFKEGVRGVNPKDSLGLDMRQQALSLKTDEEVQKVAAYIVSKRSRSAAPPPATIDGDAGRGKVYYGLCSACHGDKGQGNKQLNAPALVGQHDWYLVKQLEAFRAGFRGKDPRDATGAVMRPMALALATDQAVRDVAAYIATFASGNPPQAATAPPAAAAAEPVDVAHGEKLFATNCAACHQKNGEGKVGLAPSIRNRDFLALASDDFIRTTIRVGRPGTSMVARPDLSEAQLDNIVAYLRSLPVANPISWAVDTRRTITGNITAGHENFTVYCASCHGPKGEGYSAGGSGPGIGLPGFLNVACDDYIFQTIKHGRIGTPMQPFMGPTGLANLSEPEVNDIIVFLRSLQNKTPAPERPHPHTVSDPTTGIKLFAANCAACHQADGHGKVGLAPSIRNRDFLAIASDEFIRQTVSRGRPGTAMVPRPDLDGEPVDHIIAFLRDMPVANPVTVKVDPSRRFHGDAKAGLEQFALYCAACHGPKGEGYSAGGSGPGIGLPGFLAFASDDYIFQTVKHGRIGTPMKPFLGGGALANLTESDIHDIIAGLRSLNND